MPTAGGSARLIGIEELSVHEWRLAFRALVRRPGYTITAILMLSLGIAATTTLFSVVDTILLKPLPYPAAERLVSIMEASPSKEKKESLIAPVRLEDWNRLTQRFSAIAGVYSESVTDTSGAEPERLAGRRVSPRFFDVYGTRPIVGRTFAPEEEASGGSLAAVISYGLWSRRYGQDAGVLGRRLVLGGTGYTIIGVMPKEFAPPVIDLWIPAQTNPFLMRLREARFLTGIGRLKPGATLDQAQADLALVQRQLGEQFPRTDKDWSAVVRDLKETRVGEYRRTLLMVLGAVLLLLLVAVTNIAGLTLAQLHQREREMAIRSSVGASRAQVVAAAMREVSLIASSGALLGSLIAAWGVRLMAAAFADLPRMAEVHLDGRALGFAAAASAASAVIFGALPAIHSTRADLGRVLAESSRSVSAGRGRLQRGLVIAQLAMTVVLLSSAGLLLRSYANLNRVESGFSSANVITFHVGAAWDEDRSRVGNLQMQILEALQRLPGVESAGLTNFLPATGATLRYQVQVEGIGNTEQSATFMVGSRTIGGGYLQALKAPLVAGDWCPPLRRFAPNGANKSLVNQQFVRQYAKDVNVVGRHTRYPLSTLPNAPTNEIVGVVGDLREDGLAAPAAPFVYDCASAGSWPDPEYVVRTRGAATALVQQLRQVIHAVEPNRAVFGVKLLDTVMSESLEQPRLNARFLALFAVAALLLAAVGMYSLISVVVTARTRDIGVRIALGARRAAVVRLVLSQALLLVAAGVLIGTGLSLWAAKFLGALLYGLEPRDPATLAAAVAVLSGVGALAGWLPAWSASRIDPAEVLRAE